MYYNKQQNTLANIVALISFIAISLSLIDKFGFLEVGNAGYLFLGALFALALSMVLKAVSGIYSPGKAFVTFLRVFVGGLFIFSGFVKAIDPLGTSYKMGEYFEEFNMMFFEPLSVGFSVFMIVMEFVLGVCLLLGYRIKVTMWLLLLMIIFFTFLTGFTSYTGKVTDCGCFGDFLKLKPIQSFTKDLVLLGMILILFFNRKHIDPVFDKFIALPVVVLVTLGAIYFCLSNYVWDLPVMDFRPYKIGKNIPDQMTVAPEKAPQYDYVFTYKNKNTGEEKEFSSDDIPTNGEWTYVSRKDILIKEGETAKINSFQIIDDEGNDITEDILYNPDYEFMVVSYDLGKTNGKAFTDKLNSIAAAADKDGYRFFAVTAGGPEDNDQFRHAYQTAFPFYEADAVLLKTIVRSNPGLVLLKEGTVIAKWHYCQIPTYQEIKSKYMKQ